MLPVDLPARERSPVLRLIPIDAVRWRRGRPQRHWKTRFWQGALAGLLLVALFLAALTWLLHDAGVDADKLQAAWRRRALAPDTGLVLAVLLLQPVVTWAVQTRELFVSAEELRLRYAWAWLDRWLGWRVSLNDVRHARLQLGPARVADPLPTVELALQVSSRRPWEARRLRLCAWAPAAGPGGQAGELSAWPAPQAPRSRLDIFLMRRAALDDAQCADLRARIARLPLGQALRARGVNVSAWPVGRALAGHLDLARVPEFRAGLGALALLAAAGVAAFVGLERWHFFVRPLGLYALLATVLAVPAAVALWPKQAHLLRGVQPEATVAVPPAARRESVLAVAFMALLGGALAAWLGVCGLLWVASRTQPATPQPFVLDKRRIDSGAVILRAQAGGVPDIRIDTLPTFWRRQNDGLTLTLPVLRLGPWWMYDGAPIRELGS